jgi:hypothetical protein
LSAWLLFERGRRDGTVKSAKRIGLLVGVAASING